MFGILELLIGLISFHTSVTAETWLTSFSGRTRRWSQSWNKNVWTRSTAYMVHCVPKTHPRHFGL